MMRVRAIAAAVQSGQRSAVSVAEEALTRTAAYDALQPEVWIARVAPARVLEAARGVDARIAAGEKLALAGVPFAVKDNLDVVGMPTTAACPRAAYTPTQSSTVVARLLEAGAVLIGKTNLDQFATGLVGVRSPFGAPGCVFNRDYISGGSSSGSSVAVAAGLVPFALGTDTAGSGRVPAAFNALTGFKPTKGRWSTSGLLPACRSLDVVTVFTQGAADAALIDLVVAGLDEIDPFSRAPRPGVKIGAAFRLGVPDKPLEFFGDVESAALFEASVETMRKLGAELVPVDIAPLIECASLLYQGPWVAERTAAIKALSLDAATMHPIVRKIVEGGEKYSAVDAFEGLYKLKRYERAAQAMWRAIDVLLLPTAPTIYKISDVIADPLALNANLGRYTNFVNLLDMSAIALPAGFRANNTGFGVTLIAPAWADGAVLSLAARYEEKFPMTDKPPLDEKPRTAITLAVVGAHLQGMPLHHQLSSRSARFLGAAKTAPNYRLYAMANSTPPKPALAFDEAGASIDLELYELGLAEFGSFTAEVPPPLAIGTVTLDNGRQVKGFVAEPRALKGAEDITSFGGWRAFIAAKK
ncbi:MAG: allophanate hydrolase [Pseudomonadota bacterium]